MAINITMPRLSDTMEQGTVVKWHMNAGDSVSSGDVIADIETDKATMELESFDDGVVASLAIGEGEKVNVGETIVILAEDGESAEDAIASVGSSASSETAAKQEGGSDAPAPSSSSATAVAEPPATAQHACRHKAQAAAHARKRPRGRHPRPEPDPLHPANDRRAGGHRRRA